MKTVEEMTVEEQAEFQIKTIPLTAKALCHYEITKIRRGSEYASHTEEYWIEVHELITKKQS